MSKYILLLIIFLLSGCREAENITIKFPNIEYEICCLASEEENKCTLCFNKKDFDDWAENKKANVKFRKFNVPN